MHVFNNNVCTRCYSHKDKPSPCGKIAYHVDYWYHSDDDHEPLFLGDQWYADDAEDLEKRFDARMNHATVIGFYEIESITLVKG